MTVRTSQPEILPPGSAPSNPSVVRPRFGGGGGAFRDENLDLLSRVLDTWFRIPGTNIRFGLDGIVGFIPGIGDVLGGLASCIIVLAAYFRGVPLITIARMVANLAIICWNAASPPNTGIHRETGSSWAYWGLDCLLSQCCPSCCCYG
jgi:hypothetical protein